MDSTLQSLANDEAIQIFGGILVVLLSGITAFLANCQIAVYNDGVRPLVGQSKQGKLKYRALASMSFAMSIGYVIGFIPFSLAKNILILHTILLGSEMIGLVFKKEKKYAIISTIIAMAYGASIYWGLKYLNEGITEVTYPGFGFDLGQIVDGAFPFIFAMFPAVAALTQFGLRRGAIILGASIATYILVAIFGWKEANLYPMAITLLIGTGLVFGLSIYDHHKNKRQTKSETNEEGAVPSSALFTTNAEQIKSNKIYFIISGAIASMVVAAFSAAPLVSIGVQTSTQQQGNIVSALIADTTWVIGFIPLVVLTALFTGVYSPVGLTAVFVWGDLAKIIGAQIVGTSGNNGLYFIAIGLAGLFGGISMYVETHALKYLAKLLVKVPNMQKISDSIRTGIAKTINYAFIFGGIIAAWKMGASVSGAIGAQSDLAASLSVWLPSMGAGIVILTIIVNSLAKRKFIEIAVGPMGAIAVGILFNIIYFIFI